jgi:cyclohexa-1,5-dienecarbonyl-CoA hydratase
VDGTGRITCWNEEDGSLFRLRLARPPGNLLEDATVEALRAALAGVEPPVRAVLLDAAGPHFSYGASVAEHAPATAAASVRVFHALVRRLASVEVPIACVVTGRCLGGGLELALSCDVVFASTEATFALPEIRLGVFAPAGSMLLRERVGDGNARDLLLSGRAVGAAAALRMGLVQSADGDPEAAALAWLRSHVLPLSPSGLRLATRAARLSFTTRVLPLLDELERLYVEEAAGSPDASEGVRAFLEKRPPRWSS